MYICLTCGIEVTGYKAALKHSKQGYKTSREAAQNGKGHILELKEATK